jgi:hypothetical protein
MPKPGKDFAFRQKPILKKLCVLIVEHKRLQRIVNAELRILHFIHSPHAALTLCTHHTVRTYFVAWLE